MRLKKNPEVCDYVVESTVANSGGVVQEFMYFKTRKEAREYAKGRYAQRVRIFHMKFTLVSDRK